MGNEYGHEIGSIRLTGYEQMNKKEYTLLSEDADRLDEVVTENVGNGSTAYCVDTRELYVLHLGTWYKQGDDDE